MAHERSQSFFCLRQWSKRQRELSREAYRAAIAYPKGSMTHASLRTTKRLWLLIAQSTCCGLPGVLRIPTTSADWKKLLRRLAIWRPRNNTCDIVIRRWKRPLQKMPRAAKATLIRTPLFRTCSWANLRQRTAAFNGGEACSIWERRGRPEWRWGEVICKTSRKRL